MQLTHIAVVRDMNVFNSSFQVPFFNGQASSDVIGDAYNVLKPLETLEFQYGMEQSY